MVKRELIKDTSKTIDLVRTYSDENYKLLQKETNIVYGSSVIDIIESYDENNIPYSRFTYEETEELEEYDELEDTKQALERLSVE